MRVFQQQVGKVCDYISMSQTEEPKPMGVPLHMVHWGLFGEPHTAVPQWALGPLSVFLSLPHLPSTCIGLSLSLDSALKGR